MATASQDILEQLHADFTATLAKILKDGIPVTNSETGEVLYSPPPPATLSVIRQFLKDNDIEGAKDAVANILLDNNVDLKLPFDNVFAING